MSVSLYRQSLLRLLSMSLGLGSISSQALGQSEIDPAHVQWRSHAGQVWLNDQVFHIKGVNWFGLETPSAKLLGLQRRSIGDLLDALKQQGFNALRVPLSVQWILQDAYVPKDQSFVKADTHLKGQAWIKILDKLVEESSQRGIVILLDMHTISAGDNLSTKRWYNKNFSVCDFRKAWQKLLDRYGHRWNIMGLDLKNELHDVSWGTAELDGEVPTSCEASEQSGPETPTDWRLEVETLIPELARIRLNPKGQPYRFQGLYLVQGMHHGRVGALSYPYAFESAYDYWYGGNLEGLKDFPLRLDAEFEPQIAYTIHTYGPAVHPQNHFETLDAYRQPDNLAPVFEQQSGFIEELTGRALIIGEWGGLNETIKLPQNSIKNGKNDAVILGAIAKWYRQNCIADGFWWALNPESADTGGLFSDSTYTQWVPHRLDRATELQPNPSALAWTSSGKLVFAKTGAFDPHCLKHPRPTPLSMSQKQKLLPPS